MKNNTKDSLFAILFALATVLTLLGIAILIQAYSLTLAYQWFWASFDFPTLSIVRAIALIISLWNLYLLMPGDYLDSTENIQIMIELIHRLWLIPLVSLAFLYFLHLAV